MTHEFSWQYPSAAERQLDLTARGLAGIAGLVVDLAAGPNDRSLARLCVTSISTMAHRET